MKLNRKKLRKMILSEIKKITESQKLVGLPHQYSDLDLYHHALSFLKQNPDLRNASPEVQEKGEMLLRILHNASQKAVQHRERGLYDEETVWPFRATSVVFILHVT